MMMTVSYSCIAKIKIMVRFKLSVVMNDNNTASSYGFDPSTFIGSMSVYKCTYIINMYGKIIQLMHINRVHNIEYFLL